MLVIDYTIHNKLQQIEIITQRETHIYRYIHKLLFVFPFFSYLEAFILKPGYLYLGFIHKL